MDWRADHTSRLIAAKDQSRSHLRARAKRRAIVAKFWRLFGAIRRG
jgi:hypothetical protein